MGMRFVGRWLGLLAIACFTAGAVASCGSGSDQGSENGDASTEGGNPNGNGEAGLFTGGDSSIDGGNSHCTPTTCGAKGYTCGYAADGCGAVLQCGTCPFPEYCGGGGYDKCGGNTQVTPDGAPACTPKTCAQLGYTCGPAGDGCGGLLQCGTCTSPAYCGGGGPSLCGTNGLNADGGVPCTPTTCATLGYNCGYAGDGCGGVLTCGSCTSGQICGSGGFDKCGSGSGLTADGSVPCTPQTCASLGYNCGAAGDGCGGLLQCGTCTGSNFCGGGGYDKCGTGTSGDAGTTGCAGGGTTTLTGYVFDPGNNLPIYNALVYVPVGTVQTPQTGVVPAQCGCTAQPAYASAFTGIDGKFTLSNPPSGASVTIVVQLGKWQRVFTESITPCTANSLGGGTAGAAGNLTLPSTHLQGNIPRFAIDTGNVDSMECVLLKMGIAQSEFVDPAIAGGVPTAAQRIHMYVGTNQAGGATIDANTPGEAALTESASVMDSYDAILFPCQGRRGNYGPPNWPNTYTNMTNYANAGGRFFATHFHYDLLQPNPAFSPTATWTLDTGSWNGPFTGFIDQTFARGVTLSQWLNQPIVYGGTYGQIPVDVIRNDFSAVTAPAQRWMYNQNPPDNVPISPMPIHYTFDTPFVAGGAPGTCGRVVYSDFHVENATAGGRTFPTECAGGGLSPQEKLLEFMLFDLTSCTTPPTCQPLTCANFPAGTCGPQGDGCGGVTADCGTCTPPATCGGGGTPGMCGHPDGGSCTPLTCAQQNINCGPAGDGCGNEIQCGSCATGQTCGGGGTPGQCGTPCKPLTCAQQNLSCGPAGDGCGNQIDCGTCTPPATCGGGGVPGQCGLLDGGGNCKPLTCAAQNISCGPAGDGCGGLLQCGSCSAGQSCGGGGTPGQCSTGSQ
jgi:hypothetical protein